MSPYSIAFILASAVCVSAQQLERQNAALPHEIPAMIRNMPPSFHVPKAVHNQLPNDMWGKIDKHAEQSTINAKKQQMQQQAEGFRTQFQAFPKNRQTKAIKSALSQAKKMRNERYAEKRARKLLRQERRLRDNPDKLARHRQFKAHDMTLAIPQDHRLFQPQV